MSKEAMKLALETSEGIVNADWRKWDELASPEEFERWVKSRANHMASVLREALAEQKSGIKQVIELYDSPHQPSQQEPVAWKWQPAPIRTAWGDEMVVASVAIDKDHTVCLYCEREQIAKVEVMFTSPPAQPQQETVAFAWRAFDPDEGHYGMWGAWNVSEYEPPRKPSRWFQVVPLPFPATPAQCKPLTDEPTYTEQQIANERLEREALAKQPAQPQLAATITISQRGPVHTIDNHFEDCVRDWPDGEYKLYTSPQPAPVQQEPTVPASAYDRLFALNEANAARIIELEAAQPQQELCGHCNGSGRMVRDPDIGTDQECFVCEGDGVIKPKQPAQREPVALAQEVIGCFHAAEIEGLTEALANTTHEHLKDLVERRLMHALYAAQEVERNSK